jgi:hypothetical protein
MYSKSRNKGMEFGEFKLCHFEFWTHQRCLSSLSGAIIAQTG